MTSSMGLAQGENELVKSWKVLKTRKIHIST